MPCANREYLGSHVVARMAKVSDSGPLLATLETYLNGDDLERAGRFRFPEDRARFVLGRGLLGKCLSRYLDYPARALDLAYTPQGRPILPRDPEIQFSISHTHDLVAVALSVVTRVGIDLEYVRPDIDLHRLARRIFSDDDWQIFQTLPGEETVPAFFRAWTGKEAYLKAQGVGLSGGLREVSVFLPPGASTGSITDRREGKMPGDWHLQALPVSDAYVGSLVWNDPRKCLDFSVMDLTAST